VLEIGSERFRGVQEYCDGGSLRNALMSGAFVQSGMRSRWRSIMRAAQGIAAGMNYIHCKRILHGDLNPSNVLLKVRALRSAFQNVLCERLSHALLCIGQAELAALKWKWSSVHALAHAQRPTLNLRDALCSAKGQVVRRRQFAKHSLTPR
jgi:hypothetical protein